MLNMILVKFGRFQKVIIFVSLFALCFISFEAEGQRRSRPGSMRHTDEDVYNMRRHDPVVCKYVSSGHTFGSDVYVTGMAGRIKIGTADLILSGNKYRLVFDAANFDMRDALPPQDKWKFNPWRSEKLAEDFVQTGKYETFKKASVIYLRLYDENSDNYIVDIPLQGDDAKAFEIEEEGLLFKFYLKK